MKKASDSNLKEKMINVRLSPATLAEFKIVCDLRGSTQSGLLHQFIIKAIRQEKAAEPDAFVPKIRRKAASK